jgi:glycine/D-amino acid oxidase-like deaminating enzyme/nitrite reductase/ring-hydroxylating ferredoxin subunit
MTENPFSILPGEHQPLWIATAPSPEYPALPGDLSTDVAIIGAGIVGVSCAAALLERGRSVVILEADQVVQGVSGASTAKLTSQHGLIYERLTRQLGEEKARLYGHANEAAIARIETRARDLGIECEFRRLPAFIYTEDPDRAQKLRDEADAAWNLGLPASFVDETPLPFPVAGAVRFENQAQFHPRKYLLGVLRSIVDGRRCQLFENVRVRSIEDKKPCVVKTEGGQEIRANAVIVATHFPIGDHSLYSVRLIPHRSYLVAVRPEKELPEGIFVSDQEPVHSIRPRWAENVGDQPLLLVLGEGHRVGEPGGDEVERFRRVERFARERLGTGPAEFYWTTHDLWAVDGVPFIGKFSPMSSRVFAATGFGGWGNSHGEVAAQLIADLIEERENPLESVYTCARVKPIASAKDLASNALHAAQHLVADRLKSAAELESLRPGEGKIVELDGHKVAASRDATGTVWAVSAACSHMGCVLQWNASEQSWDCPCHGSRFGSDGRVLHGPAVSGLEPKGLA